eukprot:m.3551 g.3551  ORF g.3551 m.3551 type:complete len:453 (+) comp9529_c0_seq1:73-1431(+)
MNGTEGGSEKSSSGASCLSRIRSCRALVPFIVFMAYVLDCTLGNSIIPILPDFLNKTNSTDLSIGALLATKPFFQIIGNLFAGPLTDYFGFNAPILVGFTLITSATLIMAFADVIGGRIVWTYVVIAAARAVQGIGSALSSTAGIAMIADRYPDDRERGKMMGRVMTGVALGVIIAYPYGGAFSEIPGGIHVGWKYAFLGLAGIGVLDLILQLLILGPAINKRKATDVKPTSFWKLIRDPYLALGFFIMLLSPLPFAVVEPAMPLWMETYYKHPTAKPYLVGLIFLPATLAYLVSAPLLGNTPGRYRWLAAMLGLLLMAAGLFTLPLTELPKSGNIYYAIGPLFCMGFGIGMTDSTINPMLASLVESRHTAVYGSVYALSDIAFHVGYVVGPLYSSAVGHYVSFKWDAWAVAILVVVTSPLVLFLRSPTAHGGEKNGKGNESDDERTRLVNN